MYRVSAQGVDEHMINVHYYYYRTGQLVLAILHSPLDRTASHCYITWSTGLGSQSLLYYMVHGTGQPVLAILHGPWDWAASPCYITQFSGADSLFYITNTYTQNV